MGLFLDCVDAESISVATRRLQEKDRIADVKPLLDRLNVQVPNETITWILPDVPHLYPEVLDLIRSSSGVLNFNDALIARRAGNGASRPSPALTRSPGCAAWRGRRM